MLLESRCTRSICWLWFLGSSSILLVTFFETPCIQGNFATVHPTNQPTNQVGYNITCQVCSNLRLSEEEVAWGREGWRWRGWVFCGRSIKNTCYKCDQNFSCWSPWWSSPLLASFSGPRLVTRALEGVEDRLALPMVAARRVLHNREHHHDYQDYNHYFFYFSGHFNSFPLYFPI